MCGRLTLVWSSHIAGFPLTGREMGRRATDEESARLARRSRVVGQGLCEDVCPGDSGEAAHQPASCEGAPALSRLHTPHADLQYHISKTLFMFLIL
jgi:hypothetical protein